MIKWLFALLLAAVIFGGASYFAYEIVFKPEIAVREESKETAVPQPTPDIGGPEFEIAAKLKEEGKLDEARQELDAFLEKYSTVPRAEAAKDLLGELNIQILLSRYPSSEKQEYVVKSGDVIARIANRLKTTPELIMRMNNLSGTMLRIGDRLLISSPEFSVTIQRNSRDLTLLNRGKFFKRYKILEMKAPPKPALRTDTRVADIIAWKDGKRVGFGTKEYVNSARWIRLQPVLYLYALPEPGVPEAGVPAPAFGFGMAGSDLIELSALVNKKTAVTITD